MSVALDLGLFLRNSKTKLGLSLTQRGLLYTLAIRIGNNDSTWIKQDTLAEEAAIDIKNLQDHLRKSKDSGILLIQKQKSDKRKNMYKFNPILVNYHLMSEEEKINVHKILNDEYKPIKLSTGNGKSGAKSSPNFRDRGRNRSVFKGSNRPPIDSKKLTQAVDNNEEKTIKKSPKETVEINIYKQRAIEGSVNLSTFPDDFFPDDERRDLLQKHSVRTNNSEVELLTKFDSISRKYKTRSKNWQLTFEDFLIRELPKKTYENLLGKKCRYDAARVY